MAAIFASGNLEMPHQGVEFQLVGDEDGNGSAELLTVATDAGGEFSGHSHGASIYHAAGEVKVAFATQRMDVGHTAKRAVVRREDDERVVG